MTSRYPKNWKTIAHTIKEAAGWRCAKCGTQCIKPGENVSKLSISERSARTLQVHHCDFTPENNESSNLIPLCSPCHLSYHQGKRGNVSPGQLSLFS
ncbi:HNH endonuclease [Crocosphaera sp. UHCC 0190]|uniref:HNH endonuclease n=1 Tax=Crocosphaera sp. UHCC 0190 TaxID=3110246 RepID=UPI002B1F3802|nr:HNH endonuclease [Crocosphaera sp. UHCC 0190]MEA5511823.1 HNH endonuclease [Crocosphaera sp. UHCC 0190]